MENYQEGPGTGLSINLYYLAGLIFRICIIYGGGVP